MSKIPFSTPIPFLAAGLLGALALPANAQSESARVAEIVAPDLLLVESDGESSRVRLFGIDAPEAGQPFHDEALAFVRERLEDPSVTIDPVTRDQAGNTVAMVLLADYVNLNVALVQDGLAWWDSENAPDAGAIKRANAAAIAAEAGLWSQDIPLAPWDYRRSNGMDMVEYVEDDAPEPIEVAESDETPTLRLQGNAPDTPMTGRENPTPSQPASPSNTIDAGRIQFDRNVDVTGLMVSHAPRIATDSGGNPIGLTANNISQIPYASQLGFRDGDIVQSVNGMPVTNMGNLYGMYEQLRGSKQLQVSILRNGQSVPLTINIP